MYFLLTATMCARRSLTVHCVQGVAASRVWRSLASGEALLKLFLANAERGDNAANDDLIAEIPRRIRALAPPGHQS